MIAIGKALYSILSNNSTVSGYVGTKIYPVVIPAETQLPTIVYERSAISDYSRDYLNGFVNTVDITVISNDYSQCIGIAEAVYSALANYKGSVQGINIIDVRIENIQETFQEDCFMQKLTFSIRAN